MRIPTKPNDVTWTDDQWSAIWAKGKDILVSAAAGSGKTAVLINRMIEKVLDLENPIDVDELLVVTFTNASAAEMRHRMAAALEKAIAGNPTSDHLRKQLSLLNKAQISTLHSFCLNVVRQYAYLLDIDPGFRIANETEAALLRDDILEDVLEEAYSSDNPEAIYRLSDSFTGDRDDKAIEMLIDRLYDYSRVHPSPERWLRSIPEEYDLPEGITVDELPFIEPLKLTIRHTLEEAVALTEEVRRIAIMPNGPAALGDTAEQDRMMLQEAIYRISSGTWQETYEYFQTIKWVTAGRVPKDSCDEALKDRAKALRDQTKKLVNGLRESFFARTPARLLDEIRLMAPSMQTLVELTIEFGKRYEAVKVDRGLVDFSDLEHYALDVLAIEEDGRLKPSLIAKDYRRRFKEVLVDEYQDTNMLQETIIQLVKTGDEENGNLFMVGDVKQSIYRFRLAEPMLFLNKYLRFSINPDSDSGYKIDLNANFRSRKEVLHGTNYIFSQVMGERVGEIDYDEAAALKPKAPYDETDMPVELAILYSDEPETDEPVEDATELAEEELKKSQIEARFMVKRIKELVESETLVMDPWSGKKRPIEYRDIVVLMRSMTWSGEITEEFKLAGIPVYTELKKGYFDALEVMIMLNTLRVIDNPYQDVPLASVLRAPFVGLTDNELAKIRLAAPKEPFYEAVKQFMRNERSGVNLQTQEKLQRFYLQFEEWRNLARRGSLSELIWRVYLDTHYFEMVGAMPNGKQRQANLRALHDRAIDYERTSFRGLFRFLRFIDRMRRRGDDLGAAKGMSEKENVVRLMTIHSSKGLEFPVVFIAGIGRQFNKLDFHQPYLFDKDFGLAVKAIDPEKRIQYTSLPFLAMKERKQLEMKAEEMRVLYVAMTRAKEKLILVSNTKSLEKLLPKWQEAQLVNPNEMLPEYTRSRANSYLDWIGPAVARHPDFEKFGLMEGGSWRDDSSKWEVTAIHTSELIGLYEDEIAEDQKTLQTMLSGEPDPELLKTVTERFDARYHHESSVTKKTKRSVSELKRLAQLELEEERDPFFTRDDEIRPMYMHERPQFMQDRRLSSAEIGTAMHTIMQHIDLNENHTAATVRKLIDELVRRQLLTEEEANAIHAQSIVNFFKNDIAARLRTSSEVRREMPFTYGMPDDEGDIQILQGIADCMFKEKDGWVLLDYKTDRVLGRFGSEEELVQEMHNRYDVQLSLYEKAISEILDIRIKEKILYLFDADRTLVL